MVLGAALPVASGGTGATTAAAARTSLGATTLGANIFTITNPSAITFPRFNADNTVSALDAATFRTAIGAGTGGGSVTSVDGTGGTGISVTGGPITSSGTLTITKDGETTLVNGIVTGGVVPQPLKDILVRGIKRQIAHVTMDPDGQVYQIFLESIEK
jgi:hypothetical protein